MPFYEFDVRIIIGVNCVELFYTVQVLQLRTLT